jgi:hypothetical protein
MGLGWLLLALGLAVLTFAVIFGGREERIFALAQATSGLLGHGGLPFGHAVTRAILLDLAVLAILLPLALRSSRIWPLVATSVCGQPDDRGRPAAGPRRPPGLRHPPWRLGPARRSGGGVRRLEFPAGASRIERAGGGGNENAGL